MPRPDTWDMWSRALFYVGLSFTIPLTAVAGYFAGAFLDRRLGTGSVLALVGTLVGAGGAIADVIFIVMRREKSAGNR